MNNCPTHLDQPLKLDLRLKDYFLSQDSFELHICPDCSLRKTLPVPADLDKYYDSDEYLSHGDNKSGLFAKLYRIAKAYNLSWKTRLVKGLSESGVVLDYGCGIGDFIQHLQEVGYSVRGAEPSAQAVQHIPTSLQEFVVGPEEELDSARSYDVISMWHVLEHVPEPIDVISRLKTKLKPQGHMIIALPNPSSADANLYKEFWAAWDVPRHLWHFTPEAIESLMARCGFKQVNSHPMWLDAFYVSLLSERYRHGGPVKALFNALYSNSAALFNKKGRCSSQAYVFRAY